MGYLDVKHLLFSIEQWYLRDLGLNNLFIHMRINVLSSNLARSLNLSLFFRIPLLTFLWGCCFMAITKIKRVSVKLTKADMLLLSHIIDCCIDDFNYLNSGFQVWRLRIIRDRIKERLKWF